MLTLQLPLSASESSDYLEELLWTLPGVLSSEQVFEGELENQRVAAIQVFSDSPHIVEALQMLMGREEALANCHVQHVQNIQEADWAEAWKSYWHVEHLSGTLTIRPSWEAYEPKIAEEVVLILDPGSAFGSGSHETTRLMLTQMETLSKTVDFSQKSVLDVGTGSGILAVYAAKLGSRSIMAIDIDEPSMNATRENAALNAVSSFITESKTPLGELCHTQYDVVLANIIAPVILELFDDMILRLAPGGIILFSGLIAKHVETVMARMETAGLTDIQQRQDGEWFLLQGSRAL